MDLRFFHFHFSNFNISQTQLSLQLRLLLQEASTEYHEVVHHSHKSHEKKGGFTKRKGWAVQHIKREANQALSSLMFCMLDLQRKAICN